MKQITLIFSIFISINLYSQDYEPLLSENKYWDIVYWESGGIIPQTSGVRQYLDGDTIIHDKTYQIIRAKQLIPIDEPTVFYPPFSISENSFIDGFIREDTVNKKVYTLSPNADAEFLTYDFGIKPGDSIIVNYLDNDTIVLDTIVTMGLLNGMNVNQYIFKHDYGVVGYSNDYYIEGIGGASSLMFPFDYNFEFGASLDGVIINDEKAFCQNNNCYVVTSSSSIEFEEQLILLYPNPMTDNMIIQNHLQNDGIIHLFSQDGKLLYTKALKSHQKLLQIDMSKYNNGLYILVFETSSKTVSRTIVKK